MRKREERGAYILFVKVCGCKVLADSFILSLTHTQTVYTVLIYTFALYTHAQHGEFGQ